MQTFDAFHDACAKATDTQPPRHALRASLVNYLITIKLGSTLTPIARGRWWRGYLIRVVGVDDTVVMIYSMYGGGERRKRSDG